MSCKHLATCEFFNDRMSNMPRASGLYKSRFCEGDFVSCARYLVSEAVGHSEVPEGLFPSQVERASSILELS